MAATLQTVSLSKETLDQITPALHSMRDSLKNHTRILTKTYNLQIKAMQDSERASQLSQSKASSITPDDVKETVEKPGKDGKSGGFGGLLFNLPMLTALAASITGFDAALRAVALPKMITSFSNGITKFKTGITDFTTKVKNFKISLPELPKISIVDIEGKPYDFGKFKIKVPEIPRITIPESFNISIDGLKTSTTSFFDGIKTGITTRLTTAMEPILLTVDNIKTGTSGFFDGIKSGVTTRLTPAIETIGTKLDTLKTSISGTFDSINGKVTEKFADASEFFGGKAASIKMGVQSFFDGIPRLSVTMPEGVGKIGDSIKAVFGSMDEGTGILGFLGKVGGFLKPLMAPFKLIVKTVMRPFTQILLSVVDFVTGFYQGFTGEDGTFGDKLKAGIAGGIKGIIKGFTEAIDLIFITLPAWLMEKLGFEGIAEKLRGFSLTALVDPAWEAVKGFFTKMFNDPGGTMMSIASGAGDMAENFIKTILRMILPDPGADRAWYDPRGLVAKAIPDSVYTYAGMNATTGALLPNVAAELAAQRSAVVQQQASEEKAATARMAAANIAVNSAPTVINKGGDTRSVQVFSNPRVSAQASWAGGF
jgi:hypothetical protein